MLIWTSLNSAKGPYTLSIDVAEAQWRSGFSHKVTGSSFWLVDDPPPKWTVFTSSPESAPYFGKLGHVVSGVLAISIFILTSSQLCVRRNEHKSTPSLSDSNRHGL